MKNLFDFDENVLEFGEAWAKMIYYTGHGDQSWDLCVYLSV